MSGESKEKARDDHELLMNELQAVWENDHDDHKSLVMHKGIRSTQISALVKFLYDKGILKPEE